MTYSTGSVILASDYNIFATGNAAGTGDNSVANCNTVWATGNGNKGWGQSSPLSAVAATNTVTATQWSTMLSRISTEASQQGSSITAITSPVAGNTISAFAALSTNITTIYNNRYNCTAAGTAITASGVATYSSSWYNSLTATQTVTFSSGDAARYFFNTGGRISITYARSGGTANTANTYMTSLLTACGTLYITCGGVTQTIAGASYTGTTKVGGSGSPTISTGTGYYNLTTANVQVFTQSGSTYGYTPVACTLNIKSNGVQGANADAGSVITLYTTFTGSGLARDFLDGTLTATMTAIPSGTSYISNTWGTPTLASSITGS